MIDVDKYWLQREELIKIGIFVTKLNSYFVWIATAPSKTPTQEPNWRLEPLYIIIKTNMFPCLSFGEIPASDLRGR